MSVPINECSFCYDTDWLEEVDVCQDTLDRLERQRDVFPTTRAVITQKTRSAWHGALLGKYVIGIRTDKFGSWSDPRLSCRTPVGNVCNRGTWRVGSAWGLERSDAFWSRGFDAVSFEAVGVRPGRSDAWRHNWVGFCPQCSDGILWLCIPRDHSLWCIHNSWDRPTQIPRWNRRDPIRS